MKLLPLAGAAALVAALPSTAQAAKPMLIGWGEKISEVADLPPNLAMPGYKVGLYYNSFRLFFIPVITWDKKIVIFNDAKHDYLDLDAEQLKEVEAKTGSLSNAGGIGAHWARYCNWLWVVVAGLFIGKKVIGGKSSQPTGQL